MIHLRKTGFAALLVASLANALEAQERKSRYEELVDSVTGQAEQAGDDADAAEQAIDAALPDLDRGSSRGLRRGILERIFETVIGVSADEVTEQVRENLLNEPTVENETIEGETLTNELNAPFRLPDAQLQSNLSGQTTGLASSLGDARTQRETEALRQVLATTPDGPFVATVETPSGTSTGGFSGEEGLNIAGVLNVFAFDSGQLQDGDRVRLTVRDSRGVILNQTITLTFGGRTSRVSTTRGLVNVTITALNEGTEPPNTGGLRVSGDVAGNRNGNFDLNVGQSGTLAVRVLRN